MWFPRDFGTCWDPTCPGHVGTETATIFCWAKTMPEIARGIAKALKSRLLPMHTGAQRWSSRPFSLSVEATATGKKATGGWIILIGIQQPGAEGYYILHYIYYPIYYMVIGLRSPVTQAIRQILDGAPPISIWVCNGAMLETWTENIPWVQRHSKVDYLDSTYEYI